MFDALFQSFVHRFFIKFSSVIPQSFSTFTLSFENVEPSFSERPKNISSLFQQIPIQTLIVGMNSKSFMLKETDRENTLSYSYVPLMLCNVEYDGQDSRSLARTRTALMVKKNNLYSFFLSKSNFYDYAFFYPAYDYARMPPDVPGADPKTAKNTKQKHLIDSIVRQNYEVNRLKCASKPLYGNDLLTAFSFQSPP